MSPNEKERISASIATDESRVYAARKLSKWFSVYLRIQVFGQTIFEKWFGSDPEIPFKEGGEE